VPERGPAIIRQALRLAVYLKDWEHAATLLEELCSRPGTQTG
jgi:hypothetical protein